MSNTKIIFIIIICFGFIMALFSSYQLGRQIGIKEGEKETPHEFGLKLKLLIEHRLLLEDYVKFKHPEWLEKKEQQKIIWMLQESIIEAKDSMYEGSNEEIFTRFRKYFKTIKRNETK